MWDHYLLNKVYRKLTYLETGLGNRPDHIADFGPTTNSYGGVFSVNRDLFQAAQVNS